MLFDLRPKSRREELFDREKEIEDSELPLAYARGFPLPPPNLPSSVALSADLGRGSMSTGILNRPSPHPL